MASYWDDSLLAQRSTQYGILFKKNTPFFFTSKLSNPPAYDSTARLRTYTYMTSYLKSQGYFYSNIKDTVVHTFYKGQHRVSVTDTVYPGKVTIIDTEKYAFNVPRLTRLADSTQNASLIAPHKSPFAQDLIAAELDRLVALYRQRGFFLLTRDNLVAEADTLDQSLLTFSADPFEQAQKISEAIERKKQNPTTVITIMQRENTDTSFQSLPDSAYFKRYRTGHIYYYPEADIRLTAEKIMEDTPGLMRFDTGGYTMFYKKGLFKMNALKRMTYILPGTIYNEEAFNRTITAFNQVPSWNQVDYRTQLRNDSVDFYMMLSPARPQNMTFSLEGSRNTGDFLSTGTLIGAAFNIIYNNRNVLFKSAHQLTATLSNGVEFTLDKNYPFLQTFLTSLNLAYTIPNTLLPIKTKRQHVRGTMKFDLSPNYSERNNFFRVRSLTAGAGVEWKRKNKIYQFRFPNVELYSLDTLPLLIEAFKANPFLRTSFNTGSVISMQAAMSSTVNGKNNINNTLYYRFAGELAPIGAVATRTFYGFFKAEGEVRKQFQLTKSTSFALRAFSGVGISFSKNPAFGSTLPFFKQFIAGGPNSMRAWGLRQ
ncbi:MAG TPA: BamA/TamA family outer membrane protein, partial [Chitinophagaceae bacterium]|nr:BamA/TamA family outer membrane protein [Chitinophagaceae bacterium]